MTYTFYINSKKHGKFEVHIDEEDKERVKILKEQRLKLNYKKALENFPKAVKKKEKRNDEV